MNPCSSNIIVKLPDLTDCWLRQRAAAKHVNLSVDTFKRRQRKGVFLPHGTDPETLEPLWLRSELDKEIRASKITLPSLHAQAKKRENFLHV